MTIKYKIGGGGGGGEVWVGSGGWEGGGGGGGGGGRNHVKVILKHFSYKKVMTSSRLKCIPW